MDPQLEALLGRVEKVNAQDLVAELREFTRSLGVGPSAQGPQG